MEYFDHDADIGIIGQGKTVTIAFEDAALGMFSLMVDIDKVALQKSIIFSFEEEEIEFAFITWLNRLLAHARIENMIFAKFNLQKQNNQWVGRAWGEAWHENHQKGVEVKGATLTMLSVKHIKGEWQASCVVDV